MKPEFGRHRILVVTSFGSGWVWAATRHWSPRLQQFADLSVSRPILARSRPFLLCRVRIPMCFLTRYFPCFPCTYLTHMSRPHGETVVLTSPDDKLAKFSSIRRGPGPPALSGRGAIESTEPVVIHIRSPHPNPHRWLEVVWAKTWRHAPRFSPVGPGCQVANSVDQPSWFPFLRTANPYNKLTGPLVCRVSPTQPSLVSL